MARIINLVLVLILPFLGVSTAHPGEEEKIHLHAARPLHPRTPHISQCRRAFQDPLFVERTISRRSAEFHRLRQSRGIVDTVNHNNHNNDKRQLDKLNTYLSKSHQVKKPFTPSTPPSQLFADDGECMMAPLVSEGPLYVAGESVRRNLTDHERGIPLSLDIQVVDAKTCAPIPSAAVDIWSCNTTGIYSGVWTYYTRPGLDSGYDRSVINTTALRGIQFTNAEGAANFDTFFPGHYTGRAVHVHVMVHLSAKTQSNGTITGGKIAHISQLYFDQALIDTVEKVKPYTENMQNLTVNANDGLLKITRLSDDPFFRWVMLGDKVEDGLFGYIRLGIDTSADWSVSPAAYRDGEGGHMNLTGPLGDGSQPPKIPPNPIP